MEEKERLKESLDEATARLYRPYFASVEIQNVYYDINGVKHSIEEDSNLIEQLIQEHFQLSSKYEKTQKALETACEELNKRTVISKEWWMNWCLGKENEKV